MRHVAVAMKTTGRDPKQHRITELAAVEANDGVLGESLRLQIATDIAAGASRAGLTFQVALARWKKFIAGSTIIVHDYYEFRRFQRAECVRDGIALDITPKHPVIDTWRLAKERFPKQRHSLEAVTRRLGIESNLAASDALQTARIVARVAVELLNIRQTTPAPPSSIGEAPARLCESPAEAPPATSAPMFAREPSWLERLAKRWRVLIGHS